MKNTIDNIYKSLYNKYKILHIFQIYFLIEAEMNKMEYIKLTHENLEKEHICCAISGNKDVQVISKKAWLKERLDDGLVFLKADVRGKCFIEYIPGEKAWVPIEADGYMYIDCLWVSGQFKGHGYSSKLLDECIKDSREKGKKGLCILSSKKKMGFLADCKYLKYKGFELSDKAEPYFELWYLPFNEKAEKPKFKAHLKEKCECENKDGFTVYYTNQCPFTAKYVPILENLAEEQSVPFKAVHVTALAEAQSVPVPFTTFAMFYGGEFVTHEILSEKKFLKLVENLKGGEN